MYKYFLLVFFFTSAGLTAQNLDKEVLFTIDNEPVYVSEFERVYNKNLDLVKDESQKDVDEYLKLFVNYKLKLKEAYAKGLDEKPSYKRELDTYKKQLADNFLNDSEVTNELVQEAYDRTVNEVNVSHILVRMNENPTPEDTLQAYNEIVKLRNRALSEGFEKVEKEVHNGQTIFGEDLGYFTAFKMVYDFESPAYNTPVGEISQPFRTRFGYHILKVNDRRKSRGEVKVAHIMVSLQQDGKPNEKAEERIQDIYRKLQQGEDFESLAKQFSDDKSSAGKGGLLEPFSSGQLSSTEFEEQAFALKDVGAYSQPFKTQFGWHIVKLYEKNPVPTIEKLKPELESKVKRDSRSQLINESLIQDLKKKYQVTEDPKDLEYFKSIISRDYYKKSWQLPSNFNSEKPLVKIGDKQLSYGDFGNFILSNQKRPSAQLPTNQLIDNLYEDFIGMQLKSYQEENLENENTEYAQIVGEYRDGLLLFDLMESEIWNVMKTDSVQIQDFYQSHKENYSWNERAEASVASCSDKKDAKQVAKLLKQGKTEEEIKQALNTNDKVNVIFTSGIVEEGNQSLPQEYKIKLGQSPIMEHNGAYSIVKVSKIIPKEPKTFEEAKGAVLADYQSFKEANWLASLRSKYKISVNQDVLNKVKSELKP